MAVSNDDVRHIANLARLGIAPGRIQQIVEELNGILDHIDELRRATVADHLLDDDGLESAPGSALRNDEGPQLMLSHPRESFAPAMKDGFFLVPRLETHEGEGESVS